MKKKVFQTFLVGLLIILLSACEAKNETVKKKAKSADQKVILEVRNPKIEISSQFEQMVLAYEEEHPGVDINIYTVGGANDNLTDLKALFAAGKGPDIFTIGGYSQAKRWNKYLEDLSNQPWIENAYDNGLAPIKINGEIYGMPVNFEGYGFIYNKDLFENAGIETLPKTTTELIAAAEKLKSTGITPFAIGYYEDWVLSHLLNIAFAQQEDPDAFIKGLNDGTQKIESNQKFKDLVRLLDVTMKYGNDNPLTTDYNMAVTLFATGKTAMIQQGNWIQPMIDQLTPNMNIGFLPIPINDDPKNDALTVGVPNYWVINKQTTPEKKKEAKEFLNWMVSSKQGKKFMTEQFKFIPAFKNIETNNLGPLAEDIIRYSKAEKTLSFNWFKYPGGVMDEFGPAMQAYIGKQLNRDQLLQEFQKSWERAARK
ncbi:ABC transporter substrate-binding protein [Bacillus taeanensis]|uniref:Carbohydrate ABC transporter substrate-binding protein n=1 Tax=Bacillus taeanensis TaxID=273032 RepID=A0A366XYW6_9BACI|nr:ABC transporter substrate-binding protein [Bacillus taeanensis]RBW70758.1 carbohydrate ABC transporter substrate-binding protein [Bacillus taeanensis]